MNLMYKTLPLAIGLTVGSVCIPALALPITVTVESNVTADFQGTVTTNTDGPGTNVYADQFIYENGQAV